MPQIHYAVFARRLTLHVPLLEVMAAIRLLLLRQALTLSLAHLHFESKFQTKEFVTRHEFHFINQPSICPRFSCPKAALSSEIPG